MALFYSFRVSILLLLATTAFTAQGQTVLRKWKQVDDLSGQARSIIELYQKDGKVAGRILQIMLLPGEDPNPVCEACDPDDKRYKKPVIGMEILSGLEKEGAAYVNGNILDPENGRIYRCKVWLEGNKLKLRGYWGLFYRTQTWLPAE
jgi:uncharacterized protein (DUF2147 family)